MQRRTKKLLLASDIGVKAGKIVNLDKAAKHFELSIADGSFSWKRYGKKIKNEQQIDGIYVIRTSEQDMPAPQTVRTYKSLSQLEQAFGCLKTVDLRIRPIFLPDANHVKAHIFICVLAYYLEWHLRQSWAKLLYGDEELDQVRQTRDPVAPAKPAASARRKKNTHRTADGLQGQPFSSLLEHLGNLTVSTCCMADDPDGPSFQQESK